MIDETMEDLLNESELIPRMRTGDIINGIVVAVDQDGLLIIIDRAKDVSKLNDGTLFAP